MVRMSDHRGDVQAVNVAGGEGGDGDGESHRERGVLNERT